MDVCCGGTYTCCSGPDVIHLDLFHAISKPPTPISSLSSATTVIVTSAATLTTGPPKTVVSAATSSRGRWGSGSGDSDRGERGRGGSGSNHPRGVAVGLGVGIPLGLAVSGSLVFLGMQLRKKNTQAARAETRAKLEKPVSRYCDQGYGVGGGGAWPCHRNPSEQGFVGRQVQAQAQAPVPGELSSIIDPQELPVLGTGERWGEER